MSMYTYYIKGPLYSARSACVLGALDAHYASGEAEHRSLSCLGGIAKRIQYIYIYTYMSMCHLIGAFKYERGSNIIKQYI